MLASNKRPNLDALVVVAFHTDLKKSIRTQRAKNKDRYFTKPVNKAWLSIRPLNNISRTLKPPNYFLKGKRLL